MDRLVLQREIPLGTGIPFKCASSKYKKKRRMPIIKLRGKNNHTQTTTIHQISGKGKARK
jgi:hypothetical protein